MPASLGKLIRARRIALGLTQDELAERIGEGVRQSEISRLEHGRIALPRRQRLEQIARALDVSLGELLVNSGWAGAEDLDSAAPVQQAGEQRNGHETSPPVSPRLRDAIARAERLIYESEQSILKSASTVRVATEVTLRRRDEPVQEVVDA